MLVWLKTVDNPGDLSLRAYHERCPVNPHIFFAVHALFLEYAKFFGNGLVLVGEKRIGQVMVHFELFLGGRLVGGDAEHDRAGFLNLLVCVAEPARFKRSAGSIGLGVKEQDYILSTIIL